MPRSVSLVLAAATSVGLMSTEANARVCDYRPSELVRSGASSTAFSGALDTAAGVTEGIFTLTNTATGASLLGANTGAAGGAAGALGQISGAASAIGSAAVGVVTAPAAAVAGAVAAVGLGAYEGLCFFRDERITDYDEVLEVMWAIAESADPTYFQVEERAADRNGAIVVLGDGLGGWTEYPVRKLYISNGVLMYRDWGLNTALGEVGFATLATSTE